MYIKILFNTENVEYMAIYYWRGHEVVHQNETGDPHPFQRAQYKSNRVY